MLKDEFKKEADFVRFDGVVTDKPCPTARFRIAEQYGYAGGQTILDKDGNLQKLYHVKAQDLTKRRRKLLRQGIEPTETDKAISCMRRKDIRVEPSPPK
ncbi:MAG: hypothetical protein KJ731_01890 [Alphaproteobacteria bacterium]|nr:hypothetical protein [Alphaproteobacteria bacterium]MBU1827220.1 hypothetical protein [Alphaproteobacteria bacterium]